MVIDWENATQQPPGKYVMPIDDMRTIDSTETKHCFARDAENPGITLFAKVSGLQSRNLLASNTKIALLRNFPNNIIKCKPVVPRGKKCLSINKGYAIVGIKSDYHLREVAQYVFNKDIEEEQQINLEHACLQLLKDLEKSATVFAPFIHKERSIIGQIINRTKLNVTSELATALSIGKSYQSRRHIDADMF